VDKEWMILFSADKDCTTDWTTQPIRLSVALVC